MGRVVLAVLMAASLIGCSRDHPAEGPSAAGAPGPATDGAACAAVAVTIGALCSQCRLDPSAVPVGYDCGAAQTNATYLRVLFASVGPKVALSGQLVGTDWANLESRTKVTFAAAKRACPECFDRPPKTAADGEACPACFSRPFDGPYASRYPNGKRREVGAYVHGKRDGVLSAFHENGIKMRQVNYQAGELHGPFTEWDEGSRKTRAGTYDTGDLHGEHRRFEDTRVVEHGSYQYGVRTGRWMRWYRSGKKRSQRNYQTQCDGRKCATKRHGLFIAWDEQGKVGSIVRYDRGVRRAVDAKVLKGR
jgi:antitoxin component YwqK of YwqJK toxin-antitoxin module